MAANPCWIGLGENPHSPIADSELLLCARSHEMMSWTWGVPRTRLTPVREPRADSD